MPSKATVILLETSARAPPLRGCSAADRAGKICRRVPGRRPEGMYSAACLPTSVPGPTGAGRGAARPTSRSTLDVHRTEASAVGEPSAGTATLERVGWIELGV